MTPEGILSNMASGAVNDTELRQNILNILADHVIREAQYELATAGEALGMAKAAKICLRRSWRKDSDRQQAAEESFIGYLTGYIDRLTHYRR